jgi:hypothetical protein
MVCSSGDEEQLPVIERILRTRNNKFAEIRKGLEMKRREKDFRSFILKFGSVVFDFETRQRSGFFAPELRQL